jgi:hypothetical protein
MHFGVTVLGHAEKIPDVFGGDFFAVPGARLHNLPRHLAADIADLAFQVSDPGLAGVSANDLG